MHFLPETEPETVIFFLGWWLLPIPKLDMRFSTSADDEAAAAADLCSDSSSSLVSRSDSEAKSKKVVNQDSPEMMTRKFRSWRFS